MSARCIVLIPIYRLELEPLEEFSLDFSVQTLAARQMVFLAPQKLDVAYYSARYPSILVQRFPDAFFDSIQGYNRLLLTPGFYELFARYEFSLILQTDAIVLRDELSDWMERSYDYVGAPWPVANELMVSVPPFEGERSRHLRIHVGNGGLSLRRNKGCIDLLHEHAVARDMFIRSGSSEDLFFSFMGALSKRFVLPNEIAASCFSLEIAPEPYVAINGGRLPMGAHAWWKFGYDFWMKQFNHSVDRLTAVL
jgi:hypothetical protein